MSLEQISADPIGSWQTLHANGGLARIDEGWLIGSYNLVKAGLHSPALATAGSLASPFETAQTRSSAYKAFARFWSSAMVMQEANRHSRLREVLSAGLHRISDPAFQKSTKKTIRSLVAVLPKGKSFDVVEKFAMPVPVAVIAELLGISFGELLAHSKQAETLTMFLAGDDSDATREGVLEAAEQLWLYFAATEASESGLLNQLRKSDLRPNEITAQAILIFLAGHQTLRDAICLTLISLAEFEEYQTALRQGTMEPSEFIDETLRLESPIQVAARTARAECSLGPANIRAAERVLLCIGAANRDPQRYASPGEFLPGRSRSASIVFGAGPHTCWGGMLAQLELRLVTQLLVAYGRIRVAAPPERVANLVFRKIKRLQIQID